MPGNNDKLPVATIRKSDYAEIRIAQNEYNLKEFIDIRQWMRTDITADYFATRKGITISPERLDEFIRALHKLKEEIETA